MVNGKEEQLELDFGEGGESRPSVINYAWFGEDLIDLKDRKPVNFN